MKKIIAHVVLLLVVGMFGFAGDVFAGGGSSKRPNDGIKTAMKAPYDRIYPVRLPSSTDAFGVTENDNEKWSWFCDDDQTVEAKSKYLRFNFQVYVTELSKYNASKLGLSGVASSGNVENLNGYLSIVDPTTKMVDVSFAGQYCTQAYEQLYDQASQKWICQVENEFTCDAPEYYLEGELMLTIEPYLSVR